jgi:hypothetical protein
VRQDHALPPQRDADRTEQRPILRQDQPEDLVVYIEIIAIKMDITTKLETMFSGFQADRVYPPIRAACSILRIAEPSRLSASRRSASSRPSPDRDCMRLISRYEVAWLVRRSGLEMTRSAQAIRDKEPLE